MSDTLAEFRHLMEVASGRGEGGSIDALLDVIGEPKARLLRLVAIPHQFDEYLLGVLAPEFTPDQRRTSLDALREYSFVASDDDGVKLLSTARKPLFRQWLALERREEFAAASARLAGYFLEYAQSTAGEAAETARRRYMFHLLGEDIEAGFLEFENLFRRARHHRLASECDQLIRLVHEYDPILGSRHGLWLTYHEAKLSLDRHDFDAAESLLHNIIAAPDAEDGLLAAALVREGYVHAARFDWERAIASFEKGLGLVEITPEARHSMPRILHDLGTAHREVGELDRADDLLHQSIDLARKQGNASAEALAHNSLGLLALRRGEPLAAIGEFESSLRALTRNNDLFRSAQVYNNLGLAYSDVPDWSRSSECFRKSLEIRTAAGDTLGQASALANLARVQANLGEYENVLKNLSEAIAKFTEMRDGYHAALALHNRGRLRKQRGDDAAANGDFVAAHDAFTALGKAVEAAAVMRDMQQKQGLPWWAWAAMFLFAVICGVILIGLIAEVE